MLIEEGESEIGGLQFGIRGLLVAVAFAVVLCGWMADRRSLNRKLNENEILYREREEMLEVQVKKAELIQDSDERALLANVAVGDSVSAHRNIRRLSDFVVTNDSKFFKQLHDDITYPEKLVPCDQCEIFIFEFVGTGREGDPFDFKIMACDGKIVAVRRGESLNS